jgi:hypothetical protein
MKNSQWLALASITSVLLSSACDADDSTAPGKCRALARTFCEVLVECGLADETDLPVCRRDVEQEAECDDAVRVEHDYGRCMNELEEAECRMATELPDSCRQVIGVRE